MPSNDLTVPEQKQAALNQSAGQLNTRLKELSTMPVSQVTASIGNELIQDAKRYQSAVHAVFDPAVDAAFKAHRAMTQLRAKFLQPGESAEMGGRVSVRNWEQERQRRIEAERQEKERIALEEARDTRDEEIQHMEEQGAPPDVIQQRAAEPLVAIAVNVDEDRGKVAGITAVDRWRGEVVDMGAFLKYIADIPGLYGLVKVQEGALNRILTSSKGQAIPGVKVTKDDVIRSKAG